MDTDENLSQIMVQLDFAEQVLPLSGQSAFASELPSTTIGEPPFVAVYAGTDTFTYRTLREEALCRTGVEIVLQNVNTNARFIKAYDDKDGGVPVVVRNVIERLAKLGGVPKPAEFEFVVKGDENEEE